MIDNIMVPFYWVAVYLTLAQIFAIFNTCIVHHSYNAVNMNLFLWQKS